MKPVTQVEAAERIRQLTAERWNWTAEQTRRAVESVAAYRPGVRLLLVDWIDRNSREPIGLVVGRDWEDAAACLGGVDVIGQLAD